MKKKLIILSLVMMMSSGCSLLKIASAPLTSSKKTVPQAIEKAQRVVKCKGDIVIEDNEVVSCAGGFYSSEKNFSQKERKMTLQERVGQFFSKLSGYAFWVLIISVVLSMTGFGWVVSGIFSGLRGTGRALKEVVNGIGEGKKYVRKNGVGLTLEEKAIYNKALDDIMDRIGQNQSKGTKKLVNRVR